MNDHEDRFSRGDIVAGVQAAFALCATCSHPRSDHDGDCGVVGKDEFGDAAPCPCTEFWPFVRQDEDGLPVLGHEFTLGGSLTLPLNRRLTAELWERLKGGKKLTVQLASDGVWVAQVEMVVVGKGYKLVVDDGIPIGQVEMRKLKAQALLIERGEGS